MRLHIHIFRKMGEKDLYSYEPLKTLDRFPVRVLVRKCIICKEEQGSNDVWYDKKWRPIFDGVIPPRKDLLD